MIQSLEKQGYSTLVMETSRFIKTSKALRQHFQQNITDNRAFGYFTEGTIEDYFRPNAKQEAASTLHDATTATTHSRLPLCVITCGPGAYWLGDGNFVV